MQPQNTQQPEIPQPPIQAPTLESIVAEPTLPHAEPTPVVVTPINVVKSAPRQRHFLAAFFISFMWGAFGADRMYMGYWGLGILKLITFGGLGIWVIVDLILIMGGYMRDKQGREMLQIAEYKKFAARTVLIFAIALGVFVLVNGIALIAGVNEVINGISSGGIPGLDSLTGGSGSSALPSDLQQQINSSGL